MQINVASGKTDHGLFIMEELQTISAKAGSRAASRSTEWCVMSEYIILGTDECDAEEQRSLAERTSRHHNKSSSSSEARASKFCSTRFGSKNPFEFQS